MVHAAAMHDILLHAILFMEGRKVASAEETLDFSAYRGLPSIQVNARDLPVEASTTVKYEGESGFLTETTSASAETQVTLLQVNTDFQHRLDSSPHYPHGPEPSTNCAFG